MTADWRFFEKIFAICVVALRTVNVTAATGTARVSLSNGF